MDYVPEWQSADEDRAPEEPSHTALAPAPKKDITDIITPPSPPRPEVTLRQSLLALFIVALFDYLLYRGSGAAGYALLFSLLPLTMLLSRANAWKHTTLLLGLSTFLLIAKTVWWFHLFTPWVGFFLLFAFAIHVAELPTCILDMAKSLSASINRSPAISFAFARALAQFRVLMRLRGVLSLPVLVPLFVCIGFLIIFGLANPILASWLSAASDWIAGLFGNIRNWLPTGWQIFIWMLAGLFAAIFLSPVGAYAERLKRLLGPGETLETESYDTSAADTYALIARNTLVVVTLLFTAYAAMDVYYLWIKRALPEDISYSEYAILGTIWLTVALALTSLVLGTIFSGTLNFHPQATSLRRLAWGWTAQNLLLAVFAVQRLYMYISFNGLTRWRTVGAFGILLVVIGLLIVAYKMKDQKTFLWMVRRQLKAFALMLFVLFLFPIDYVAHTFNTHQILAGEKGPAFQIISQPISAEGLPALIPLLDCEDETIRNGTAEVLLRELQALRAYQHNHRRWTYLELSRHYAQEELATVEPRLRELMPRGISGTHTKALEKYTADYHWPGRPRRRQ